MNELKILIIGVFLLTTHVTKADYICYYLINTEIKHSMDEHEQQKEMKEEQLKNLALETANENQWDDFKETTKKIQSRLNHASLALQAVPTSVSIVREIERTYDIQERIYKEIETSPEWIVLIVQDQVNFIDKLQMNIRLMAGIILSYGTINQMEKAERKILLDFAKMEFQQLRIESGDMLRKIRNAKRKVNLKRTTLRGWVERDKKIIKDIIKNAEMY